MNQAAILHPERVAHTDISREGGAVSPTSTAAPAVAVQAGERHHHSGTELNKERIALHAAVLPGIRGSIEAVFYLTRSARSSACAALA